MPFDIYWIHNVIKIENISLQNQSHDDSSCIKLNFLINSSEQIVTFLCKTNMIMKFYFWDTDGAAISISMTKSFQIIT